MVRHGVLSTHRIPASVIGHQAQELSTGFDAKDWNTENKKVTKELRAFDGDMAAYDNWRRRIRDHFVSVNCNYAKIFDLVEQSKTPINWHQLATSWVAELPNLN